MKLPKYSIGTGDRFGCQGKALLRAIKQAEKNGLEIAIVWNKSYREHLITKTTPLDVLEEAQNAVDELKWRGNYYIDADHINLSNVDLFIESSTFFTIDVAEFIGKMAPKDKIQAFTEKYKKFQGKFFIPNIKKQFNVSKKQLKEIAEKYLLAVKEAAKIYKKIEMKKGRENFIIEISMDEANEPQTPIDIFFILAIIAEENIPIQTFAPRLYGRFNKGIDYQGDVNRFAREFDYLLAVIQYATEKFSLLDNLKLSIHSGSDKFSIYRIINNAIKKFDVGIHLKTSGTTWLEELIGLAISGEEGLIITKEIYNKVYSRLNELCLPYATVIDIKKENLPPPEIVNNWTGEEYRRTLCHDLSSKDYNPDFRQILHVGYKIAAEMRSRYLKAIRKYENIIAQRVTENIYENHIKKVFF
ncbi:MAG: tagaturonate epimerase family protein [Promethearchaeota archaeon]